MFFVICKSCNFVVIIYENNLWLIVFNFLRCHLCIAHNNYLIA